MQSELESVAWFAESGGRKSCPCGEFRKRSMCLRLLRAKAFEIVGAKASTSHRVDLEESESNLLAR